MHRPRAVRLELSLWDLPAAQHQCQVFGRAAERRARAVRPVKVGGQQAAPLNAGAEVRVHPTRGEVVQERPASWHPATGAAPQAARSRPGRE